MISRTILRSLTAVAALTAAMLVAMGGAAADCGVEEDWPLYRQRFIMPSGRVVDTGNGGISHSEGQGYGMILAAAARDRATFEAVWSWTERTLQVRNDSLLAWKWDPGQSAVADRNDAADGDLLVAWALLRAATVWHRPAYRTAAAGILDDVRRHLVRQAAGYTLLLPGAQGFEAPGGLVVNLSYWLFPATSQFAQAAPSAGWPQLAEDGRRLLAAAEFGPHRLPPDWLIVSVDGRLAPAPDLPAEFGYNAVRIPLHLAWAGDRALLARFAAYWRGVPDATLPATYDLVRERPGSDRANAGIRAVAQLTVAAAEGRRPKLPRLDATADYYAASLLLLSRLACREMP